MAGGIPHIQFHVFVFRILRVRRKIEGTRVGFGNVHVVHVVEFLLAGQGRRHGVDPLGLRNLLLLFWLPRRRPSPTAGGRCGILMRKTVLLLLLLLLLLLRLSIPLFQLVGRQSRGRGRGIVGIDIDIDIAGIRRRRQGQGAGFRRSCIRIRIRILPLSGRPGQFVGDAQFLLGLLPGHLVVFRNIVRIRQNDSFVVRVDGARRTPGGTEFPNRGRTGQMVSRIGIGIGMACGRNGGRMKIVVTVRVPVRTRRRKRRRRRDSCSSFPCTTAAA